MEGGASNAAKPILSLLIIRVVANTEDMEFQMTNNEGSFGSVQIENGAKAGHTSCSYMIYV